MRGLRKIFWLTLAGLFLFEAWLWDFLGAALATLVAALPIARVRAAFENFVRSLSPWASVPVFVIPVLPLLPLKVAALFLLAHHHFVLGVGCFVAAKVVGFATGAYLFELCRPKLLQLSVLATLYATLVRWRALAHALIEPYRQELRKKTLFIRVKLRLARRWRRSSLFTRLRARSRRWIAARNG